MKLRAVPECGEVRQVHAVGLGWAERGLEQLIADAVRTLAAVQDACSRRQHSRPQPKSLDKAAQAGSTSIDPQAQTFWDLESNPLGL